MLFNKKTSINRLRFQYCIVSVMSFFCGAVIYIFFRNVNNMVLFNIIPKPSFLMSSGNPINAGSIWVYMFLYNLPDGLWFLSGLLIIRAVWLAEEKQRLIYFCIFLLAALIMEISQISLSIPGTFDFLDIVFMVLFAITENLIFIRGEGLIPESPLRGITSGRFFSVLNPRPIPYENNITRPFRARLLIKYIKRSIL